MNTVQAIQSQAAGQDLALLVPLNGVQLIEASAGTGKTYALVGIYTRLIVERRLSVRQILVVTFTRAATEELKSRLRARLLLCADVAAGPHLTQTAPSAELAQCRTLVAAALREETADALRSRLRLASLELDTAQISTIHGFCQRALREHAPSYDATADGELIASDRDLIRSIAADLWREHAVAPDPDAFAAFAYITGGAQSYARILAPLLEAPEQLLPLPAMESTQARNAMQAAVAACSMLAESWRQQGVQAFVALGAHAQAGHINATSYPLTKIEQHVQIFARAFADGRTPEIDLLERYTTSELASSKCIKKNKPTLMQQPFFDAIAAALVALERASVARTELGLHLLRTSIGRASQRLNAIKRAARRFSYDDLIRRLHAALTGPHAGEMAQALHEQYPCALVDEFQDTDPQQFAIFDAIYRDRGTLFLIGDPKQAIYRFRGGDIHAYLAARQRADSAHSLTTNFRSTPGYLRALDHLYTFAGDAAFADARIRFEAIRSGGAAADDDLLIDGRVPIPLTIWLASEHDDVGNKSDATERLAHASAAAILDLLARAREGRVQLRDRRDIGEGRYRALEPRDIAVLVNTNDEAIAMQTALSGVGVPSVSLSKRSVFATNEARELHLLLDALLEFDEARLRAALSTLLFGCTLADFAALAIEPERWRERLAHFAALREVWIAHGVLAMLERIFEQRAAALLAVQGGERCMTNWLQLADLAQAASAQAVGLSGLADWLAKRIAHADDENEDEQLRLESDADRVQVRTVHASKGLEYSIVFLPFAALRRGEPKHYPRVLRYHGADDRAAAYFVSDSQVAERPDASAARAAETAEDLAERLRVLYVGLTRARHATFVAVGAFGKKGRAPALLRLLGVDENQDAAALLPQRLHDLAANARDENGRKCIAVAPLPEQSSERLRHAKRPPLGLARQATRRLLASHGMYSFSRLSAGARGEAPLDDERAGVDDEQIDNDASNAGTLVEVPAALRDTRFGTAFHEILEKADFSAWRNWRSTSPPPSQRTLIDTVLLRHALIAAGSTDAAALQGVTKLIVATLNAPMPFGARLADIGASHMRAELPFHFAIADADAAAWLRLMHAHRYLPARTRFALDGQSLAGLMTGVLDLVVLHQGQWWVVDYKTNLLGASIGDYAPPRLAQAVREGEYDLQYLIYLVALHRWLKSRLGSKYEYSRNIGGALYLFVRGLDGGGFNGIHRDRPPADLIEALDLLLAARAEVAA